MDEERREHSNWDDKTIPFHLAKRESFQIKLEDLS